MCPYPIIHVRCGKRGSSIELVFFDPIRVDKLILLPYAMLHKCSTCVILGRFFTGLKIDITMFNPKKLKITTYFHV